MADLESIREEGSERARRARDAAERVRAQAQHAADEARRVAAEGLDGAAHVVRDAPAPPWLEPRKEQLAARMEHVAERAAPQPQSWRERLTDPLVLIAATALIVALSSLVIAWRIRKH